MGTLGWILLLLLALLFLGGLDGLKSEEGGGTHRLDVCIG